MSLANTTSTLPFYSSCAQPSLSMHSIPRVSGTTTSLCLEGDDPRERDFALLHEWGVIDARGIIQFHVDFSVHLPHERLACAVLSILEQQLNNNLGTLLELLIKDRDKALQIGCPIQSVRIIGSKVRSLLCCFLPELLENTFGERVTQLLQQPYLWKNIAKPSRDLDIQTIASTSSEQLLKRIAHLKGDLAPLSLVEGDKAFPFDRIIPPASIAYGSPFAIATIGQVDYGMQGDSSRSHLFSQDLLFIEIDPYSLSLNGKNPRVFLRLHRNAYNYSWAQSPLDTAFQIIRTPSPDEINHYGLIRWFLCILRGGLPEKPSDGATLATTFSDRYGFFGKWPELVASVVKHIIGNHENNCPKALATVALLLELTLKTESPEREGLFKAFWIALHPHNKERTAIAKLRLNAGLSATQIAAVMHIGALIALSIPIERNPDSQSVALKKLDGQLFIHYRPHPSVPGPYCLLPLSLNSPVEQLPIGDWNEETTFTFLELTSAILASIEWNNSPAPSVLEAWSISIPDYNRVLAYAERCCDASGFSLLTGVALLLATSHSHGKAEELLIGKALPKLIKEPHSLGHWGLAIAKAYFRYRTPSTYEGDLEKAFAKITDHGLVGWLRVLFATRYPPFYSHGLHLLFETTEWSPETWSLACWVLSTPNGKTVLQTRLPQLVNRAEELAEYLPLARLLWLSRTVRQQFPWEGASLFAVLARNLNAHVDAIDGKVIEEFFLCGEEGLKATTFSSGERSVHILVGLKLPALRKAIEELKMGNAFIERLFLPALSIAMPIGTEDDLFNSENCKGLMKHAKSLSSSAAIALASIVVRHRPNLALEIALAITPVIDCDKTNLCSLFNAIASSGTEGKEVWQLERMLKKMEHYAASPSAVANAIFLTATVAIAGGDSLKTLTLLRSPSLHNSGEIAESYAACLQQLIDGCNSTTWKGVTALLREHTTLQIIGHNRWISFAARQLLYKEEFCEELFLLLLQCDKVPDQSRALSYCTLLTKTTARYCSYIDRWNAIRPSLPQLDPADSEQRKILCNLFYWVAQQGEKVNISRDELALSLRCLETQLAEEDPSPEFLTALKKFYFQKLHDFENLVSISLCCSLLSRSYASQRDLVTCWLRLLHTAIDKSSRHSEDELKHLFDITVLLEGEDPEWIWSWLSSLKTAIAKAQHKWQAIWLIEAQKCAQNTCRMRQHMLLCRLLQYPLLSQQATWALNLLIEACKCCKKPSHRESAEQLYKTWKNQKNWTLQPKYKECEQPLLQALTLSSSPLSLVLVKELPALLQETLSVQVWQNLFLQLVSTTYPLSSSEICTIYSKALPLKSTASKQISLCLSKAINNGQSDVIATILIFSPSLPDDALQSLLKRPYLWPKQDSEAGMRWLQLALPAVNKGYAPIHRFLKWVIEGMTFPIAMTETSLQLENTALKLIPGLISTSTLCEYPFAVLMVLKRATHRPISYNLSYAIFKALKHGPKYSKYWRPTGAFLLAQTTLALISPSEHQFQDAFSCLIDNLNYSTSWYLHDNAISSAIDDTHAALPPECRELSVISKYMNQCTSEITYNEAASSLCVPQKIIGDSIELAIKLLVKLFADESSAHLFPIWYSTLLNVIYKSLFSFNPDTQKSDHIYSLTLFDALADAICSPGQARDQSRYLYFILLFTLMGQARRLYCVPPTIIAAQIERWAKQFSPFAVSYLDKASTFASLLALAEKTVNLKPFISKLRSLYNERTNKQTEYLVSSKTNKKALKKEFLNAIKLIPRTDFTNTDALSQAIKILCSYHILSGDLEEAHLLFTQLLHHFPLVPATTAIDSRANNNASIRHHALNHILNEIISLTPHSEVEARRLVELARAPLILWKNLSISIHCTILTIPMSYYSEALREEHVAEFMKVSAKITQDKKTPLLDLEKFDITHQWLIIEAMEMDAIRHTMSSSTQPNSRLSYQAHLLNSIIHSFHINHYLHAFKEIISCFASYATICPLPFHLLSIAHLQLINHYLELLHFHGVQMLIEYPPERLFKSIYPTYLPVSTTAIDVETGAIVSMQMLNIAQQHICSSFIADILEYSPVDEEIDQAFHAINIFLYIMVSHSKVLSEVPVASYLTWAPLLLPLASRYTFKCPNEENQRATEVANLFVRCYRKLKENGFENDSKIITPLSDWLLVLAKASQPGKKIAQQLLSPESEIAHCYDKWQECYMEVKKQVDEANHGNTGTSFSLSLSVNGGLRASVQINCKSIAFFS